MSKLDMMKIGLSLMTHVESILSHVVEIKGRQEHGKQELIQVKEKNLHVAVYREYFETEHDAEYFVKFCNQIYAMKKDQLPPIHILIVLFKAMLPIMTPQEMKGKQSHAEPKILPLENHDKFTHAVILKEVFTEKEDAKKHLEDAEKIKSMKL